MPRHNAAEAMPAPQEEKETEIEDLSDEAKLIEPPPIPETEDTKEALQTLKDLAETRDAHLAEEERKKILADRDKASTERMKRAMGASVLHELPPEHVIMEGEEPDEKWAAEAARNLGPRKRQEPPPIPADAMKKPEAKKPWYKRLFGSKE
jgi:hypothetical protein